MTNQQPEKLCNTFINAIMERCAKELGITVDALRFAYINNEEVRKDLDGVFDRHIKTLGEAA